MNQLFSSSITKGQTIYSTEQYMNGTSKPVISSRIREYDAPSQASTSDPIYQAKLPTFIDVIGSALIKVPFLHNASVQQQVVSILVTISDCLAQSASDFGVMNRLSQIHLTENDDESALLEWNFDNFRIGFSVEIDEEEASYFIVSEDRSINSFKAETSRINKRYNEVISAIISYVIMNT